ncbi:dephospho-CoA kinase [uncultured Thiodictyon sp.]|uniref:dephospho-CoA kinase n=1 Tax=uncultured Thiodictyon sp. TaxID=1846217 RepID=UPI0025D0D4B0|nr:dephospho-CoA kinase [uncultured Thiodictyon sp.]
MLTIGLTGGIGSGKSTVAERFAALGAGVIDTDLLARELTEPGTATLGRIAAAFDAVLQPDGQLDRAALRALVFADPAARRRLESILHPPIRALMLERAAQLPTPYAVLVIPLLFETGQETLVDRVLAVDCPEPLQIERVCRRSGLAAAEVARIVATQVPRIERLARADEAIDNQGEPAELGPQIERLHRRYLALARSA